MAEEALSSFEKPLARLWWCKPTMFGGDFVLHELTGASLVHRAVTLTPI